MNGKLIFTPFGHIPPIVGRSVSHAAPADVVEPDPQAQADKATFPAPTGPKFPDPAPQVSRFATAGLDDDRLPVRAPKRHLHRH